MGLLSWLFGPRRTRIVVRFDTGPGHHLFLRGSAAPFCWERGLPMSNQGSDLWVWETKGPIPAHCEFKVLIDDQIFEEGPNHRLVGKETCTIRPVFPSST
jgi:hypothetical protein